MDEKIDIAVVVNGQVTIVDANPNSPLGTIIPKALHQTNNKGQPPENWELRDANGVLLDLSKKIRDFNFPAHVRLFLNLKAGVGGDSSVPIQFVEPAVSIAKFNREIAEFRSLEEDYRQKGWFLVKEKFPVVVVMLAAIQLRPPAIVTAIRFDYTNYDAQPPSVLLVNPFTLNPYLAKELPTFLQRRIEGPEIVLPGMPEGARARATQLQPLMQWHSLEDIPFFCIAGVKEYHEHPAHSGDSWELHRAAGAGRLVRLIEAVHRYGVAPLTGYSVQLIPQVGFETREFPT
jgi:hypothetical protein